MATVNCTLSKGLTIGETIHKEAVIREVTAGDLIDATDDSEKLVLTPEGSYTLIASPTLVGVHTLRRQIVSIGTHPGPLTLSEIKLLSGKDLELLQQKAEELETASLKGVEEAGKKS